MSGLAERQLALVNALVLGTPVPSGFDAMLVVAARDALLGKRAAEVARAWPMLAASFGSSWPATFASWAAVRPTQGALRDGWDFARSTTLSDTAAAELAQREANWRYNGSSAPRRRWLPVSALRLLLIRLSANHVR
ncbi:hypothetical protein ABIA30_005473 [Mycobacterium sp. MAA66]|uniref:hypothetical protein n=1 Tax=Mycobacterium sp. MAA66 TaxID=3156297 RepID=UPI003516C3FA